MDRERGTFKVKCQARAGRDFKGLIPDDLPKAACQNFVPPSRRIAAPAHFLLSSQTNHSFSSPKF
jgi:hypothetical protein